MVSECFQQCLWQLKTLIILRTGMGSQGLLGVLIDAVLFGSFYFTGCHLARLMLAFGSFVTLSAILIASVTTETLG